MPPTPFDAIQPLLVNEIPRMLAGLKYSEPICIVRLFYYDTHSPYAYLDFRCVTVSDQDEHCPEGDDADLESL